MRHFFYYSLSFEVLYISGISIDPHRYRPFNVSYLKQVNNGLIREETGFDEPSINCQKE